MRKILFVALSLISSFVYAEVEKCTISACQEGGFTCNQKSDGIYRLTDSKSCTLPTDAQIKLSIMAERKWDKFPSEYWLRNESTDSSPTPNGCYIFSRYGNGKFEYGTINVSGTIENKPTEALFCAFKEPEPPKMCDFSYCSQADKRRFQTMNWYQDNRGCSAQTVWRDGNGKYRIRYSCTSPANSTEVCYSIHQPIPCDQNDGLGADDETPVDPSVPCFGNVEDCNTGTPPDWTDPETGVPCWGEKCSETTPPDYVDPETGVPCWGDKCGISPPTDGGNNGNNGGENGGNNGGENGGNTGTEGEQACVGDWCIDLPGDGSGGVGFVDGKTVEIPKTFWEQRDKETIKDKYTREIERKNPYDFRKIDTTVSGSGQCPVFKFDYIGDVSPPCWLWDMLGVFFSFAATFLSFVIVFWRR